MTASNKLENISSAWAIRDIKVIDSLIKKVAVAVATAFLLIGYFFPIFSHFLGSIDPWRGDVSLRQKIISLFQLTILANSPTWATMFSYWKNIP